MATSTRHGTRPGSASTPGGGLALAIPVTVWGPRVRGPGSGGPRRTAPGDLRRPSASRELLARARSELSAAQDAADPAERFRRAHLGALRAGAAVLAQRRPAAVRGRPRSVWELLEREAPELDGWAAYFAGGAALRAAVETGRDPVVSTEAAEDQLAMARRFLELVEDLPAAEAS